MIKGLPDPVSLPTWPAGWHRPAQCDCELAWMRPFVAQEHDGIAVRLGA